MLRSDDVSFSGVHPAVLTPFGESREVRVDALREAVDWLIECGVDGIVGLGTLAEFRSLAADERRSVLEAVIESVAGRVPVTIGISAETAEHATELAEEATTAGAQALMCLPPLIYHAADGELIAFFGEVAKASRLPLMVYNNPTGSRNDLSPEVIARLFELETIAAVKECSGDARRIPAILELTDGRMQVLVGGDDWALEGSVRWSDRMGVGSCERRAGRMQGALAPVHHRRSRGGEPPLPQPPAAGPVGHAPEARSVLQGSPGPKRQVRGPHPVAPAPAFARGGDHARPRHGRVAVSASCLSARSRQP